MHELGKQVNKENPNKLSREKILELGKQVNKENPNKLSREKILEERRKRERQTIEQEASTYSG